jgi:hypothetical protein
VTPNRGTARDAWKSLLLLGGFAALIVGAFILPQGRTRLPRDPCAQALMHLLAIEPGMTRSVLESHAHSCFCRPDGVEVFAYPSSDMVRIDVRFDIPANSKTRKPKGSKIVGSDVRLVGGEPTDRVIAVGSPYFAPFPLPDHLFADHLLADHPRDADLRP